MVDKNIDQRKVGIIISYAGQLIHILTGIIYTPILLRLLGQSEYGLYQLVYSVVSYLSLLSLGFSASYMRFYTREKVTEERNAIAKLNGMFMLIFCVISVICLLCGSVMIINIRNIFGAGLMDYEYGKAKVLMALMIVNLALTFPNSVFNCIITSQERFLFQKTVLFFHYLLNPFLTLPILLMGYGSIGMVAITTILTWAVLSINIFYCLKKLHSPFKFKGLKISLLKEMWVFTFFIFLNQVVDQINWSVDKFLLGRIVGTTSVAVYGVGGQINTLYLQLSSSVSNVFIPKVNKIVVEKGDDSELTKLFTKVGRVQFIIMAFILTGFVFLGQSFIRFWAGNGYDESYTVTLLLIFPVTVPLIQNIGIEIQRAKNKHKARSVVYFFVAISNVFLSIPLIRLLGATGAAIGTAISLIAGNIFFMNWYYYFKLNIDIVYYWKSIAKVCRGLIVPIFVGVFNMRFIEYDNMLKLFCGMVIYGAVYCLSMFFGGMNQEEKSIVMTPLLKVLKK